jgi:Reverse transcriptase (RNA-dependent DNA polymerase)
VFLVLYVDDILLIGNDIPTLEEVKSSLKKIFSMKDLGEAAYVLGIRIYRDRSRRLIGLSQESYLDNVLKRFNMQDSKKGNLPMSHGIDLSKKQCPKTTSELESMKKIPYASAIGSIMYAMICTRPDVSYALSVASRHQTNPGFAHWTAEKTILKYLRKSKDMFLVYGGETELVVRGYTDASFQTDRDDLRSQSGFVFTLNGGVVSWRSSKQDTTADSTTEAEYIAASEAAKEGVWIKKFVAELGMVPSASGPLELYCDNNGAIAQAKEPRSHQKSKHVLRRYHLIREIVERCDVKVCKIDTEANTADPLTKPLSQAKHTMHTAGMGIKFMRDWQ